MFLRKIFNLTNLTLVTALTLSVIAAWYSILGLVAIFSAAAIPIIIMGTALEVSKVVTTVWLHAYWDKVKWSMRTYLVVAVILLAFLTSMGIFGFLSKAHSDQSLVSGDVQSKIALYDEKIKIAKENIDANRRALKQLDEAVDQVMGRSTSEQGAERSVQIRRQQAPERQRLLREIEAEQKKITSLNEERAPIAAEVRKVEAEVGPIKYIAAMIYGDDPDSNLLERAVRWVIILIVIVFDPLALTLVLAANESRRWDKQRPKEEIIPIIKEPDPEPIESDPIDESPKVPDKAYEEPIQEEKPKVEQTYLNKPWVDKVPNIERVGPQVYKPDIVTEDKGNYEVLTCSKCGSNLEFIVGFGNFCTNKNCDIGDYVIPNDTELPIVEEPKILAKTTITPEVVEEIKVEPVIEEVKVDKVKVAEVKPDIKTEGVTRLKPYKELDSGYIVIEGKGSFQKEAAKSLYPEMFMLTADSSTQISTNFGTEFPRVSNKGDVFVRVDILPNKVFKFDGIKWIEMVKKSSHSYLYDKEYIKHLIKQIENGSYDVELLTDYEREMIEDYLKNQNT